MLLLLLDFPDVWGLILSKFLFVLAVGFDEGFDLADLGVEVRHDLAFAFLPVLFPGF